MKRVYYKYTTTSWTQPELTSNSTSTALGTIYTSASAEFNSTYAAWRAMDGGSDYSIYYDWAVPGDQTSGWWKVSFPYKLKISNILFTPRADLKVYIYTDEGKSDLIAELGDGVSDVQTTNIPVNIVTDRLYIEVSGGATVGIAEITLTAARITGTEESSENDYDYFVDVGQAFANRKYYKYIKTPWSQPHYDDWLSNDTSTWLTTTPSVACDGALNSSQGARDVFTGGWHTTTSYPPHWVGFYTEKIEVESFSFYINANDTAYIPTAFKWQGSNDGTTWVDLGSFTRDSSNLSREEYIIPIENRQMFAYNRLYITAGNSRYQYISGLVINAVAKTSVEGTPQDYDYFVDVGQVEKSEVRRYYKYTNEFNGTQYGGSLNDKIYTGGSGYYLDLDYLLPLGTANSWEFQTVYTYDGGGANACVLGTTTVAPTAPIFGHIVDDEFMFLLSSDGVSWNLSADKTGITAVMGRTYYFKFGFTGSGYYVDYNTDGSDNYTRAWTLNSSQKIVCTTRSILMNNANGSSVYASYGQMDLSKTLFIINGKTVWRGLKGTQEGATPSDYDFYKDVDVYKA